ncbi:hypothetical protein ERS043834_00539, partial [Streptococcus pneumoniae]
MPVLTPARKSDSQWVISTDDSVQMKTSSDMMAEDWYQKAIHQGAMPVLTPARKSDSQWVIS